MKPRKHRLLMYALALAAAAPALAQVDKAAIRTTGISCGVCAGLSEYYFKRLEGVDKVTISLSQEAVILSYKPDGRFDPAAIRRILKSMEVGVVQMQINAQGSIQEQSGKRFFVAGKSKFVLAAAGNAPGVPVGTPVLIEGILNDRVDPMEVKILNFKPVKQ
jgi:copper chaperone CopZ